MVNGTSLCFSLPFFKEQQRFCLNKGFKRGVYLHRICLFNLIALRMAKTLLSFGHTECNRVKSDSHLEGINENSRVVSPERVPIHLC